MEDMYQNMSPQLILPRAGMRSGVNRFGAEGDE